MPKSTSGDKELAQVKIAFDNFVKEVKSRCEESGFTKNQISDMEKFCKTLPPGTESIEMITAKFSEIAEANGEIKKQGDLKNSTNYKEFITMLSVIEDVSKYPTEKEEEIIMDRFQAWLKDGKPKPKLSKEATSVEEIMRIYRRKYKGQQYISYVVKGKEEQVGMRTDIEYGKNPDGQEDTSIIIYRNRYPTIPYSEELANSLIKKAKRHNADGMVVLCFVFQGQTRTVHNEKNFFGDFDELINKAFKGEMI